MNKTSKTQIKTTKNDVCPICGFFIVRPNCWVKYHVSYKPVIVVLACKYCNFAEYKLRNEIFESSPRFMSRFRKVILFHRKFGIIL